MFAVDPFTAGAVYCGTSRGNFYGSRDGGSTWETLRSGPAFPGYYVTALVADPVRPGRLWAALVGELGGGLIVASDDRGATWSILLKSATAVWSHGPAPVVKDQLTLPPSALPPASWMAGPSSTTV